MLNKMGFMSLLTQPLFDADGGGGTGGTAGGEGGTEGNEGGDDDDGEEPPKTFTQDDLNRIGKKEKKAGIKSVLAELGVKTLEEAKALIPPKGKEDEPTEMELMKKKLADLESQRQTDLKKQEAKDRISKLVESGVPKAKAKYVDGLVVQAMDEDTDYDEALKQVKLAFPEAFVTIPGTGRGGNPNGGGSGNEGLGSRLVKSAPKRNKSSFFK